MDAKKELLTLRGEIDRIDDALISLFMERMRLGERVAHAKSKGGIALVDDAREREVIASAVAKAGGSYELQTASLMRTLIALSKSAQAQKLDIPLDIPQSATPKTGEISVAYQGVPGAWGEHAAHTLYGGSRLIRNDYFEDVFLAVKAGGADYGVVPIENSQTGAIGEVYDLLRKHGCFIVGEIWVTVAQCLLAVEGAQISDIKEVVSHPEALWQCRGFLQEQGFEQTSCRNTAVAASMVADKGDKSLAAIGSRRASTVYGLNVLKPDIMDTSGNRTRFIAIAAAPVFDENSATTSISFSTAHRSGALCSVLQSLASAGINMKRIESRPDASEHYRFYADLEANVKDEHTQTALLQAAAECVWFSFLGCYDSFAEGERK